MVVQRASFRVWLSRVRDKSWLQGWRWGEGLHGTNAVAIGSNEGSATVKADVGKACHKRAVLEPARTDGSLGS